MRNSSFGNPFPTTFWHAPAVIAMVVSLQTTSLASELPSNISTVKDLLFFCDGFAKSSSTEDIIRSSMCFGYVTGAVQTNRAYSLTFKEAGLPVQICLTDQDKVANLVNDLIVYFKQLPSSTIATTAIAKFLMETHPCR